MEGDQPGIGLPGAQPEIGLRPQPDLGLRRGLLHGTQLAPRPWQSCVLRRVLLRLWLQYPGLGLKNTNITRLVWCEYQTREQ